MLYCIAIQSSLLRFYLATYSFDFQLIFAYICDYAYSDRLRTEKSNIKCTVFYRLIASHTVFLNQKEGQRISYQIAKIRAIFVFSDAYFNCVRFITKCPILVILF